MQQVVLDLYPEIKEISDSGLREKTSKAWEIALEKGGWKVDDLLQMPFTLLIEKVSVNIVEHTRAVTLTCLKIADVLNKMYGGKVLVKRDFLVSGALLHDVGKLFEYKREENRFVKSDEGKLLRHPISGANLASSLGLPTEVVHIIAAHSKEGDGIRRSIEAVIVNHADFINFDIFKE